MAPTYGMDTSLNVQVVEGAPRIAVELDWQGRGEILVGEEVELALTIKNTGSVAVEGVQLFLDGPGSLRLAGRLIPFASYWVCAEPYRVFGRFWRFQYRE